jgi:DHA2 family multidrug resistance protein
MQQEYYTGFKFYMLVLALSLGTFIQVLDISIANVAIPYIAGNLSVSADQGTWVITSFAVSNAIVLPLTGWLSDYFGRVRLFCISLILFSLMSLLCGLSTSLGMLVACRFAQGAVAGSLIPLSQSLLIAETPQKKQGTILGFWGMIVIVAPVLGPIIGGYLTDVYSWPWIFFINVPIGVFSAIVTWFMLKSHESALVRNPIDWVGLFLLSLAVSTFQIMLDNGKDFDWFESNIIIILTIVSIVAMAYFIVWNKNNKYPIVDFEFFKNRNFLLGSIITTLGYLFYFCSTVIIPLWLQTVQNYTPFWAGVAVAPVGIAPLFLSIIVGKYLHRFDLRYVAACSFLLFAGSFFYQASFTTQVSLEQIMFARFLQGFGLAIFFIPLLQLSIAEIPAEKYASAAGVFHFIRILVGSGFGTSLAVELWWYLQTKHHIRLSDYMNNSQTAVVDFVNKFKTEFPLFNDKVVATVLDGGVTQQAYMLSTNDISWLMAWIFIFMIPVPFLCKKVKPKKTIEVAVH